jgi:hypothetical protein
MAKRGFVYLICDPSTDLFKIGLTTGKLENRLKKLQTGNGTELHLVTFHETEYPYKIEKMLHNHFSNKKELNEWFNLDTDDINTFNEICEKKEEIIKSLSDNPFFEKL